MFNPFNADFFNYKMRLIIVISNSKCKIDVLEHMFTFTSLCIWWGGQVCRDQRVICGSGLSVSIMQILRTELSIFTH